MSERNLELTPPLYDYLLAVGTRESVHAADLRLATREATRWHRMQIGPEQGAFLALLVRLIAARRILEVGTFTGYSALVMAEALPPDGRIVTCDVSAQWTAVGQPFWQRAGVASRIELRLGPAEHTLDELIAQRQCERFDLAFIDADKTGYDVYYERCLTLLRPGGLLAIDNVLWSGRVANPHEDDEDTRALQALNEKVHADARVHACMLPIGDGLTLAIKRPRP